jgi:MFS family permease
MVLAVSSTLLAVSIYGPQNGWSDPRTVISMTSGFILTLLFLRWESQAVEPILPLSLFKNHTFNITSVLGFIIGAGMFGALIMLPLYLQVVQGESPSSAGLKLIPLMLGIVTTSIFSGKAISKTGKYKKFPIAGTIVMTSGLALMTTLGIDTPYWQVAIFAAMVGMGLGLTMQTMVIALQNSVDFKDLGVSTTSNTFFRSLGSVFGAAIFGSILTNRLGHYLVKDFADLGATNPAAVAGFDASKLEGVTNNTAILADLPPLIQQTVLQSFVNSFNVVFLVAAPVISIGIYCAFKLREVPLRTTMQFKEAKDEVAGESLG